MLVIFNFVIVTKLFRFYHYLVGTLTWYKYSQNTCFSFLGIVQHVGSSYVDTLSLEESDSHGFFCLFLFSISFSNPQTIVTFPWYAQKSPHNIITHVFLICTISRQCLISKYFQYKRSQGDNTFFWLCLSDLFINCLHTLDAFINLCHCKWLSSLTFLETPVKTTFSLAIRG